ncbi:GNAT superfamily N-acetyltransferase [Virgibacillus halotolerans]|uniref:GNAT family N-acetyltransferase n=1 Tax=Virgibacillus halotolerans TaxID=1071053 RepID=UPI00195FA08D|nr:GNAT family N-acetyltransferase [Virgibacillus halotolerans]MBM7599822.1 GNAT superfamily N-acetyltransferase [Virgibacillus halotolerans]
MSGLFREYKFGDYNVRKAGAQDLVAVYGLLRDTASWLKAKGISQWEELLHSEENNEARQAISSGITHLVEDGDGDLAAMFNLSGKQNDWDIDMWGKQDDLAYYLHKLAVAKGHHQQQIGRQILDWIDENILLENGYVRLDCVADNSVLNDFYQRAGYTFVGYASEGKDNFSLYEKLFTN